MSDVSDCYFCSTAHHDLYKNTTNTDLLLSHHLVSERVFLKQFNKCVLRRGVGCPLLQLGKRGVQPIGIRGKHTYYIENNTTILQYRMAIHLFLRQIFWILIFDSKKSRKENLHKQAVP